MICQFDKYIAVKSELTGRTIFVNESLDQFLVSPEYPADAIAAIASAWVTRMDEPTLNNRPPPSLLKAVSVLGTSKSREQFAANLQNVLVTEFYDKQADTKIIDSQQFLIQLMLALWSCGAIAWPVKITSPFVNPVVSMETDGISEAHLKYLKKIRGFLDRNSTDDSANARFLLDHLLARSGICELGDITPETFSITVERCRLGKMRGVSIQAVLRVLRDAYPDKNLLWRAEDFGFYKNKSGPLARDDHFEWLLKKDPNMAEWARLAIEHLKKNPANYRKRKSSINNFLQHYLDHVELPRNPVEYFNIRNKIVHLFDYPGNKGRQVMSVVHDFLNEVLYKVCVQPDDNEVPILMPGFATPLVKPSYKNVNKGETHREAMPTRLINLAVKILTENDFAWAKESGRIIDTFRWLDPNTKEFESIWSPVRVYALLIKLLLPARTYQVRMLDSGEGDTYRYLSNGVWEHNQGCHGTPSAQPPIERGVFRKYKRKDGSDGCVFYFNTNKTADIENIVKGYVMPWEKQDALDLLIELRNWQEKYNPVNAPTAWADIVELQKTKHADDLAKMGTNYFLFRDPSTKSHPGLPVTDVRIRNLWVKLMDEMERRLAASGEKLSTGEPIKLVLTRDANRQPLSSVFDLHALRVSIITAMYEEGVPPEYLMKIVGHATVLMTLYYTKINAETLSLRMDEALIARQKNAQTEMAGFIKRASRMELEQAVAFRHSSALDAAKSNTGIGMLVMDHGMCPTSAKRCSEGLAINDASSGVTKYQAIPGGAGNCTRCRFFMTGPAFLFGLEAHVNDLAYQLKKASFSFENAQVKFDALSDAFAESMSSGQPFHNQRELEIAECALESSTAEVDGIALSLQAAYALTEQCIRISNQNHDGLSLIAAGGCAQLEAVLSESHEFEQLNRICLNATLFDGLQINWQYPNLERARLFDRMLRNSGHEPRFSLLDDEDALRIANAMGQFLYARLDANTVHSLIDGRTTLRAIGMEKAFISQLETLKPTTLGCFSSSKILEQA